MDIVTCNLRSVRSLGCPWETCVSICVVVAMRAVNTTSFVSSPFMTAGVKRRGRLREDRRTGFRGGNERRRKRTEGKEKKQQLVNGSQERRNEPEAESSPKSLYYTERMNSGHYFVLSVCFKSAALSLNCTSVKALWRETVFMRLLPSLWEFVGISLRRCPGTNSLSTHRMQHFAHI